jgi:hypothetical protein
MDDSASFSMGDCIINECMDMFYLYARSPTPVTKKSDSPDFEEVKSQQPLLLYVMLQCSSIGLFVCLII